MQEPVSAVEAKMRALGFCRGWGRDVGRLRVMMQLGAEVMEVRSLI